jgi:hypothetical protein
MRGGMRALVVALGLLFAWTPTAHAVTVQMVSGNVTYHLDNAQPGFTSFGPSANNGIDFNPTFSAFQVFGQTAFATLNFEVYGNDAGGGNVFAFDDFDFVLQGVITAIPGTVDVTVNGTVDVIRASQGGSDIGNPGTTGVTKFFSQPGATGAWSAPLSWNIFDDFLDGTAFETAVATGLHFSLTAVFQANGTSISSINEAMSSIGVSVQPGVAVPEPGTGLLVALGLVGVASARRVRRDTD